MLRRLWKSVDRLADIEQARLDLDRERMSMQFPKWEQAGRKLPENKLKTTIGHVNVEDLNKKYALNHPEEN
jgi:hypothetical protein